MPFPFMSDGWIEEARALRDQLRTAVHELGVEISMNVAMTDCPLPGAPSSLYIEVSDGTVTFDVGRLPAADVDLTVAYPVAKEVLLSGSMERALHEIVMGTIEVDGDFEKLLEFGGLMATDGALVTAEIGRRLSCFTS